MKEKINSLSTLLFLNHVFLLKIFVKAVSSHVCNALVNVTHPPPPKKICVYELAIRPICPGLAHLTKWNRFAVEMKPVQGIFFISLLNVNPFLLKRQKIHVLPDRGWANSSHA